MRRRKYRDRRRGRERKTRGRAAWEKAAVENCEGGEQEGDIEGKRRR